VARYYLDTSALVKRYAAESGTAWITNLAVPTNANELWTVRLTGPEMISALFRKVRTGEIMPADAVRAANDFREDWQHDYEIVEATVAVTERAMLLAERYGLRGYDAVHLAAALEVAQIYQALGLPVFTFVSADTGQISAAQAEGLLVENPNNYP
jgi:uncharacterized protein